MTVAEWRRRGRQEVDAMVEELTDRQFEVLDTIALWQEAHGWAPTVRELAEHLEIRSLNGVSDHLKMLERKRFIERGDGARAIRLTDDGRQARALRRAEQAGSVVA